MRQNLAARRYSTNCLQVLTKYLPQKIAASVKAMQSKFVCNDVQCLQVLTR